MLWVSVFGCSAFLIVYAPRVVTTRKGSTFNIYWCWVLGWGASWLLSRKTYRAFFSLNADDEANEFWTWMNYFLVPDDCACNEETIIYRRIGLLFGFLIIKLLPWTLKSAKASLWSVQVIPQFAAKTRIFLSLFIIFSRYKKNHSSCCILSFVVPILGALYGQSCFYLTLKSEQRQSCWMVWKRYHRMECQISISSSHGRLYYFRSQ
jgi:hypothetical protein